MLLEEHTAGAKTLLADVSEFQPNINDAAYLAWSKAIVIRAAYGAHHDDRAWFGGDRRNQLHDGGALFLGIYQYVTANEDVVAQAREFCRLVGTLRQGEYPLADWEEGSGNLDFRRTAWNRVVAGELGFSPGSGYSGLFFARDHGLAPVEWVAAYQAAEPPDPHLLWQFTDRFQVPGVGMADCSVYHGSVTELASHAFGGVPAKPPAPPPFPYPPAHYLGMKSADPACHSGAVAADRPHIAGWQRQMRDRGWTISADGLYGTQSFGVCRAFQAEKGLAVDGKCGPATWRASWASPVS